MNDLVIRMLKGALLKLGEHAELTGKIRWISTDIATGKTEIGPWSNNLIMFSTGRGRQMILDRLSGNAAYSGIINYVGIGTSSTAVAITDTQLGAETVRTTVATATISANVLTIKGFYADANLPNGSYYEAGTFVDGTASANSGQMFNHGLFGSVHTKTTGKDTTVQIDITLS